VVRTNPFIEPCLPTLAKEPPIGFGWVHEVKFDGYRLQLHKEGKDVVLLSKNGNDFTSRFQDAAIAASLIPTKSVILDCELTACRGDGTPDFGSLLHQRGDVPVCIWVFDILAQNGKDLRSLKLSARRQKLNKLMARVSTPAIQCSQVFFDAHALLKVCGERQMEGIVSKRVDRPYVSGPSKDWIKVKCPEWRESNVWRHEFFAKQK
jgi:bifunctional non-homologous end joining protein LigD